MDFTFGRQDTRHGLDKVVFPQPIFLTAFGTRLEVSVGTLEDSLLVRPIRTVRSRHCNINGDDYERKGEVKTNLRLLTKQVTVKMKSFRTLALSLVSVDAAVQVQNVPFPIRSYLACDSAELVAGIGKTELVGSVALQKT